MKSLITTIIFFISTSTLSAAPVSGEYGEGLLLGVNKNEQTITGHYLSYGGWDERTNNPRFQCSFYLHGKLNADSPIAISTWYPSDNKPDIIKGTISFSDQKKQLTVKLDRDHGGCWNVQPFANANQPASYHYPTATHWIEMRVAKAEKPTFIENSMKNQKTCDAPGLLRWGLPCSDV